MAAGPGWPGGNVERVSANVLVEKPGSARTGCGGKWGLRPASQGDQAAGAKGEAGLWPGEAALLALRGCPELAAAQKAVMGGGGEGGGVGLSLLLTETDIPYRQQKLIKTV